MWQYQHDVSQLRLARMLDNVVEDCVNAVGVDLNTASVPLLSQVSGLSRGLAENIVAFRDAHGAFPDRRALKQVPRLGAKTFELAAGFLRIAGGSNPLDASAVHPEAYPLVQRILGGSGRTIGEVIGNPFGRFGRLHVDEQRKPFDPFLFHRLDPFDIFQAGHAAGRNDLKTAFGLGSRLSGPGQRQSPGFGYGYGFHEKQVSE